MTMSPPNEILLVDLDVLHGDELYNSNIMRFVNDAMNYGCFSVYAVGDKDNKMHIDNVFVDKIKSWDDFSNQDIGVIISDKQELPSSCKVKLHSGDGYIHMPKDGFYFFHETYEDDVFFLNAMDDFSKEYAKSKLQIKIDVALILKTPKAAFNQVVASKDVVNLTDHFEDPKYKYNYLHSKKHLQDDLSSIFDFAVLGNAYENSFYVESILNQSKEKNISEECANRAIQAVIDAAENAPRNQMH